ncbi:DsbA family oxidoreductase [Salinimicrobium sp. CDJ15-91]|uniref:DsbA family oxidoreductase n=1 Tax=Salinimicrobium oceani TaxID=2722702 RepID=A0ABX1D1N8_9FLAO|nr:DsbA family oxidoreductase [Salinimicrobium oceani]
MKIDIWSDVRCPFCYIGKHNLETALKEFEAREEVKVEWHSFQLDPNLETQPELSTIDYFKKTKNISEDQARQMLAGAKEMGAKAGLNLDLENSILANSFRAHQVIQLAKENDLANEIEEALFKAHFSERKNIDEIETLVKIGKSVGLKASEVRSALEEETFAYAVKQDELEARNIGVRGVPFFVIDSKYGVSGAQPSATFLEVLKKVKNG